MTSGWRTPSRPTTLPRATTSAQRPGKKLSSVAGSKEIFHQHVPSTDFADASLRIAGSISSFSEPKFRPSSEPSRRIREVSPLCIAGSLSTTSCTSNSLRGRGMFLLACTVFNRPGIRLPT
ncbi:unnamed protein product [Ixodes hexagonus]